LTIKKRLIQLLPFSMLLILLGFILQRAWVSDDAYITFRTIDNLVNGYRLTWNPAERVQVFTHPLWMAILTGFYFFTHEIYLTSMLVSILFTIAAVLLLIRSAHTPASAAFVVLILCLSNAFIDYATSGLENPPGHLLIILFVWLFLRKPSSVKNFFFLSLLSSLAAVTRMDSVLIFVPALLLAFWQTPQKRKALFAALAGQLPFILWEIFSLFYYGFLFPNTAYAKLNTFIPAGESAQQGIYYLLNSLQRDPITLLAVAGALIVALLLKDRLRLVSIVLGACLYILYVINIGGDFMSGRFFTLPLFAALAVLAQINFKQLHPLTAGGLVLASLAAGLLLPPVPAYRQLNPPQVPIIDSYGIADERLWYFSGMGLFRNGQFNPQPSHPWITEGIQARQQHAHDVVIREGIGLYGFYAGPQVYIIDIHALSDPLLARLPAKRWVNWQIGHFERVIPGGHTDTMKVGYPAETDHDLREFDTHLFTITSGNLFSMERWVEIWKMNTGQYNALINTDRYQFPTMSLTNLSQLGKPQSVSANPGTLGALGFGDQGLDIDLQGTRPTKTLELSLEGNDNYLLMFMNGAKVISSTLIPASTTSESSQIVYTRTLPDAVLQGGCSHIRILPVRTNGSLSLNLIRGDGTYSIGYLLFR
jgi:arabinofuranosyltransferase